MIVRAFIGLGGNLGDARQTLDAAMVHLASHPDLVLTGRSAFYRTAPWGVLDQPDFVNAAVSVDTSLPPHALLDILLETEHIFGRVRDGERWGPRTLDLDLLLHGTVVVHDERLEIPHPRMAQRAFVLLPLAEIDPTLTIPGQGRVANLLETLDRHGCERLS